jgi:hypothetical protein
MLSPKLLEALREHWRGLQHKPSARLFPGNRWHTSDTPIDTKVVWNACKEAAQRTKECGWKDGDRGGLAESKQTHRKKKAKYALTSTGSLMEGVDNLSPENPR